MNVIQDSPFRTPNAHSRYPGYGRPRRPFCEILKNHEKSPDSTTIGSAFSRQSRSVRRESLQLDVFLANNLLIWYICLYFCRRWRSQLCDGFRFVSNWHVSLWPSRQVRMCAAIYRILRTPNPVSAQRIVRVRTLAFRPRFRTSI